GRIALTIVEAIVRQMALGVGYKINRTIVRPDPGKPFSCRSDQLAFLIKHNGADFNTRMGDLMTVTFRIPLMYLALLNVYPDEPLVFSIPNGTLTQCTGTRDNDFNMIYIHQVLIFTNYNSSQIYIKLFRYTMTIAQKRKPLGQLPSMMYPSWFAFSDTLFTAAWCIYHPQATHSIAASSVYQK